MQSGPIWSNLVQVKSSLVRVLRGKRIKGLQQMNIIPSAPPPEHHSLCPLPRRRPKSALTHAHQVEDSGRVLSQGRGELLGVPVCICICICMCICICAYAYVYAYVCRVVASCSAYGGASGPSSRSIVPGANVPAAGIFFLGGC